ncbi:MAG: arginine--tRNA ligase [Candidatus Thiodiazotropha lotti]|nr:arginine--tRNA ligase [Candidatus Thiodiazotropha lotti]MCG7998294.1 arginine--tRNA ligase [Candidatus Thiodiazotropha lotti]MCW4182923.1 arginine--tRNA ligase [Candidatus Thiodiazotropha weberae]MCW4190060.1 arginine--tRNA ligase [Candidatus Thiodiazotropha weberae]
MKKQIEQLVVMALQQLAAQDMIPSDSLTAPKIERARDSKHGDFATNAALVLAKPAGKNPRELAQAIIDALPASELVEKCDIAGPGFINFTLSSTAYHTLIPTIINQADRYGRSDLGAGKKVQVEYVSANPTGPLHVGHGRGAAYGSVVADLLEAVGYQVHREYYVNDAGRQMDILATSVWLRYLELCDESLTFPANGYKGDYVWDIAATLHRDHGEDYKVAAETLFEGVPADEPDGGDKEAHIDGLIQQAKKLLGDNRYRFVFELGLNTILDDIRDDLSLFGVNYEEWYSERSLMESGAVNQVIERLRGSGHLYEKGGALWFRSTDFGDEKDRVVVRDNGQTTYFASDIAYHLDKLQRGFERVIDVWGADHHGYVPRVKAALQALGEDADKLDVLLVQFAILYRGGEKMQMSTRSGEFVTLRELRKEVGADAARFFYVMRKCEQHMDFDLDLAKSQSNDNPVYYVQYAHARICSVLQQAAEQQITIASDANAIDYACLVEPQEEALLTNLAKYPEALELSALSEEPHQLTHYLRDLATDFHTYYNAHKFLVEDAKLRDARLQLILATRQVIRNGLGLLGVSAPEKM